MKKSSKITTILLFLLLLVVSGVTAAQKAPAGPPLPLRNGETWVNPKPGIVASDGRIGTKIASTARGYGDASLTYFLNYVSVHGQTWLNQFVSRTHQICARVITLDDAGVRRGGNDVPQCRNAIGGGVTIDSVRDVAVACGHTVATRTFHSIVRSGVGAYNWGAEDFDAFIFCQ